MKASPIRIASSAALIYFVMAALWIVFSDRAVERLVHDGAQLTRLQTWKGLLFVTVTGLLLFLGLWRVLVLGQRSQVPFQRIYDSPMIGIHFGDATGRITDANDAFLDLLGYGREDLTSGRMSWKAMTPPEWAPADQRAMQEALTTGLVKPFEKEYLRKDGRRVPVLVGAAALEGQRDQGIGFVLDLTKLKEAEQDLDRLFTFSLDLLSIADFQGRLRRINTAWESTLGYPREDFLARPVFEFMHLDDREAMHAVFRRLAAGEPVPSFKGRCRCKDGSYRWLEWTTVPVVEEALVYSVARDITAQRQLEDQFIHAQKMEPVGRLAGGVAHDFNNLLTAILGYCELALERTPRSDPNHRDLEEILKAAERARSLTQQLLAFSRRQVLEPRVVDLNSIVADMGKMLRPMIGEDIDLVPRLHPDLWQVRVDPGQFEHAIVNLVVNARDAMPRGGKLTIETSNVDLDGTEASHRGVVKPGPYVLLAVSDTGEGMEAATLAHIFEPFFTTKAVGKGTGLGLSTVYGVVKQSNGYIWAYSEPGRGSTFKVYLPRVEEPVAVGEIAPTVGRVPHGSETILLVEDDDGVRELVAGVLRDRGYTVLMAHDGDQALEIATEHPRDIHALVTDVVMPGMSGRQIAQRVAGQRPGIRVLYMSGYTDDAIVRHGVLEVGAAFIQKPFSSAALARKVRDLFDSPAVQEGRPGAAVDVRSGAAPVEGSKTTEHRG